MGYRSSGEREGDGEQEGESEKLLKGRSRALLRPEGCQGSAGMRWGTRGAGAKHILRRIENEHPHKKGVRKGKGS